MTMTLEQVRDWHRAQAVAVRSSELAAQHPDFAERQARRHDECANAIDAHLSQPRPVAQGEAVAWFPTLSDGSILRHFSDGTPVPANVTKEGAEKSRLFHLGTSGNPVVPLFATPTIPAGYSLVPVDEFLALLSDAKTKLSRAVGTVEDGPSKLWKHEVNSAAWDIKRITEMLAVSPSNAAPTGGG